MSTTLVPQTKLTTVKHVNVALCSAPSFDSVIEIAKNDRYSLRAYRNVKRGVVFSLESGLQSWGIMGFTRGEATSKKGSTPLATVIQKAVEYIDMFKPADQVNWQNEKHDYIVALKAIANYPKEHNMTAGGDIGHQRMARLAHDVLKRFNQI